MATLSSLGTTLPYPPANVTASFDLDKMSEAQLVYTVYICMSILAVPLSVMTNISTMYVLNKTDSLHETESLLYKALAISDINAAVSQASFTIKGILQITKGCILIYLYTVFVIYISIVIIVVVNINRFWMIMWPFHHMRSVTSRRLYFALLVGILSTFVLIMVVYDLGIATSLRQILCMDGSPGRNKISDLASNLLLSAPISLGLFVIVFTSSGILYKSRRQARRIAQIRHNVLQHIGQPDQNNPQANHQAIAASALKSLRTIGAITISYIIVWLVPFISVLTRRQTSTWHIFFSSSLVTVNTIWNPIILCIANKSFRIASLKVILKIKAACCRGSD